MTLEDDMERFLHTNVCDQLIAAKAEIANLKAQLLMSNSNWPHEKGLREENERLKGIEKDHLADWKRIQDAERECERLRAGLSELGKLLENRNPTDHLAGYIYEILRPSTSLATGLPHIDCKAEIPHKEGKPVILKAWEIAEKVQLHEAGKFFDKTFREVIAGEITISREQLAEACYETTIPYEGVIASDLLDILFGKQPLVAPNDGGGE